MNKLMALGLVFIFLISGLSFIVMSPLSNAEPANIIYSQTSFAGNGYFGFQPNTSGNFTQYLNISNTTIVHNSYVNLSLGNYWINSTDVRGIFIPAIYAVWSANFAQTNFISSTLAFRANITIDGENFAVPAQVFNASYYSPVINLTYYYNITSLISYHQGYYPIYLNLTVNSTNDYTIYVQTIKWFNSALQSSQVVQVNHLVNSVSQNVKFIKTQPEHYLLPINLNSGPFPLYPYAFQLFIWINNTKYYVNNTDGTFKLVNDIYVTTSGANSANSGIDITGNIFSNITYKFSFYEANYLSPYYGTSLIGQSSWLSNIVIVNASTHSYTSSITGSMGGRIVFDTNANKPYYINIQVLGLDSANNIAGFVNYTTYLFQAGSSGYKIPQMFIGGYYRVSLYYDDMIIPYTYDIQFPSGAEQTITINVPVQSSPTLYTATFSTYNSEYITQWDISIYKNNTIIYASGLTDTFVRYSLPDGEYTYSVFVPTSYGVSPITGSFIINGNNIGLSFYEYNKYNQFLVNFNSSNHITSWNVSVYLNGILNSYSKNTFNNVSIPLYNGTYTYSIVMAGNYSVHNRTGSFSINGKDITLLFTQSKLYTFIFYESGLPANTEWYVNLSNGQTNHSTSGQMIYLLLQGTYSFSAVASEYTYINNSITIPQTFEYVNLNFNSKVFAFNVYETGLLNGTEWYLNLSNGMSGHSQTNKITFSLQLGKVNYTAFAINYGQLTGSVIIPVNNLYLTFTSNYFTFTFLESGLASGKEWYVNLTNGMSNHTTSDKMTFKLQVGSYNYITDANAYNVNSGTISIPSVIYTTVNFTSATEIRNNTFYFFITGVTKGSAISLYINGTQYTTYNNTFILTLPVYNSSHYYNIYFANNSVYSTNFAPLKISNSSEHIYYVPYISNLPASISFFAQYSFYIYLLMFVGAFGLIGLSIKYAYRRRE